MTGLMTNSIEANRLRWHARRGLLELDIILQRFLDMKLASLTQNEMALVEEMLLIADNDLLDLLMGRAFSADKQVQAMIDRIRFVDENYQALLSDCSRAH